MNKTTESKMKKAAKKGIMNVKKKTKTVAKKTGLIRFARSDRPLLRGHVTHLINSGYR